MSTARRIGLLTVRGYIIFAGCGSGGMYLWYPPRESEEIARGIRLCGASRPYYWNLRGDR
jgi:hypothetical protein